MTHSKDYTLAHFGSLILLMLLCIIFFFPLG